MMFCRRTHFTTSQKLMSRTIRANRADVDSVSPCRAKVSMRGFHRDNMACTGQLGVSVEEKGHLSRDVKS